MPHFIRALLNKTVTVRTITTVISIAIAAICIAPISNLRADPIMSEQPGAMAVTSSEINAALTRIDGLEAESDTTPTTEDEDSAMEYNDEDSSVDVPQSSNSGITIAAAGKPAINISLPNASQALDAVDIGNGTVAYASKTDSANSVQITEDGSVRLLNVIDSANAPTNYVYEVTLPVGYHIEKAIGGALVILNEEDELVIEIQSPWAEDAHGYRIPTYYTITGNQINQFIDHRGNNVAYPIVADPWYQPWTYTKKTYKRVAAVYAGATGCYVSFVAAPTIVIPIAACSGAAAGIYASW